MTESPAEYQTVIDKIKQRLAPVEKRPWDADVITILEAHAPDDIRALLDRVAVLDNELAAVKKENQHLHQYLEHDRLKTIEDRKQIARQQHIIGRLVAMIKLWYDEPWVQMEPEYAEQITDELTDLGLTWADTIQDDGKAPWDWTCPACGFQNQTESRMCDGCGKETKPEVVPDDDDDERRDDLRREELRREEEQIAKRSKELWK